MSTVLIVYYDSNMEREKKKRIYFQPFNNPYHQTDSELHTTNCKNTIKCSREEATAQHWRCTVAISAGVQIRAGFNTIRQNYIKKCDTRSCYFAKKTWIAPFREDSFLLLFGSIFDGVLHSGLAAPQLLKRGHRFSFGRQVFDIFSLEPFSLWQGRKHTVFKTRSERSVSFCTTRIAQCLSSKK